ncbi:hypothetical protein RFI_12429 [Reticulomyxa filosa]|uniref:Uncharacterized protein n=1 Tax=Reticulomyxa filosa TaxID=46433 RepID=X6NFQ4_RETFI|nr:hypothetical protein RFI_12429 [Reticulomyxa filosa]|eukprot:ETO24728.1 hypothetical protein RFI_12429 [Reticulomyxa filosa]
MSFRLFCCPSIKKKRKRLFNDVSINRQRISYVCLHSYKNILKPKAISSCGKMLGKISKKRFKREKPFSSLQKFRSRQPQMTEKIYNIFIIYYCQHYIHLLLTYVKILHLVLDSTYFISLFLFWRNQFYAGIVDTVQIEEDNGNDDVEIAKKESIKHLLDKSKKENGGTFDNETVEEAKQIYKVFPFALYQISYYMVTCSLPTFLIAQGC